MTVKYWIGTTSDDWNTNTNWELVNGGATVAPVSTDDLIFDGRTALDGTAMRSALTNLDQDAINLDSLTILPTYTGTIGAANAPLIIQCSGTMIIEGTGSYYIQASADDAVSDGEIAMLIVNTTGNVFLSSQYNNGSWRSRFESVHITKGTVVIYGDADSAAGATHGGESGTFISTLWIQPAKAVKTGVVVTMGDQCFDQKNTVFTLVEMREGVFTAYSSLGQVRMNGGEITIGGTEFVMGVTDDSITAIVQSGGKFIWKPNATITAPITAAVSPIIGNVVLYAGIFDASSMASTTTTNPTITQFDQYPETTLDMNNGFANFVLTTYNKFGGKLKTTAGQDITFA